MMKFEISGRSDCETQCFNGEKWPACSRVGNFPGDYREDASGRIFELTVGKDMNFEELLVSDPQRI